MSSFCSFGEYPDFDGNTRAAREVDLPTRQYWYQSLSPCSTFENTKTQKRPYLSYDIYRTCLRISRRENTYHTSERSPPQTHVSIYDCYARYQYFFKMTRCFNMRNFEKKKILRIYLLFSPQYIFRYFSDGDRDTVSVFPYFFLSGDQPRITTYGLFSHDAFYYLIPFSCD